MLHVNQPAPASTTTPATTAQPVRVPDNLRAIAVLIKTDWKKMYFGAVPYVEAMLSLHILQDNFGQDSAESIVRYFLCNAATWRGPIAKAVKEKLRFLLKA